MDSCCTRPDYRTAWVPCWPFKAKYCMNCGEVTDNIPGWLSTFWLWFVWPFWNGKVIVETGPDDELEG